MKTIRATGEFAVTFNAQYGDVQVGECEEYSRDFAGDDIDALAVEVIADNPRSLVAFVRDGPMSKWIIGRFFKVGDDQPIALMVRSVHL